MFVAIGWVLVIGSVIGSFMGVGGHLKALFQPFELLCIFGAAVGAFVVSNPVATLKKTLKVIPSAFKAGGYSKDKYVQLIALLYELLQKARKEGMMALEVDVEAPENSPTFKKYEHVLNDHHLLEFIVDYLRMMSSGNINALEMQDLMDEELETHHAETSLAAGAIQKMADGLPAFGIVAAVMGVVHTMGSVGAAPAILGEMIAGALVGTFLGILLSYGFFGPLADLLTAKGQAEAKPFQCVKSVLLASMNGYAPAIAVEFGRKVLFTADRPTFKELDDAVRATKQPKSA
ncbi:flagellar motor stator protein MotA [Caballeronia mineralivorans]|jgi:chemotaxis protein MotA|uniref:Flagellar motor protein MotA n=1 Tax=Caballeronia mineralivorans PML1(12) TaxID=908627 RepID=A0A0J1CZA7_9BURK|nr:flagellar motor stator protein MotA [Caballeronia mineralivorans]KLU25859.1 flagellar motor protein MotA [Caballeronia mineralivorans PML1(12)]MDB5781425.1 flagellar motor stator protein MotA [Caballeronia mineralivorans]MEA3103742.1 chemotaxis protein MotA [Caballeronia mineralivorans]